MEVKEIINRLIKNAMNKDTTVNVRLQAADGDRLKKAAAELRMTKSTIVRYAVKRFCDEYDKQPR